MSWDKTNQKWMARSLSMGRRRTSAATTTRRKQRERTTPLFERRASIKPLNFPDDLSTAPGVYVPKKKRVASSRFRGVNWDKTNQRWLAKIYFAGKSKHIGSYVDETEAARAYDATVRAQSLDRPLNFPDDLSTAPGV